MAIFRIEERDPFEFWHYIGTTQITNFSEWDITLEEVTQTVNLQMRNGANYPKYQVPIADVRFRIEGGSDETFTTVSLLRARLKARNYNPLLDPPTDGSQNLAEVLAIGGREIKYHDTTTGNYTLIASDKNKIIILLEDTEIDIVVPASGFSDGDSVIIQNPNGTENANFDISGVQTYSDFSPLLPSYSVAITYALGIDAYGASYSTNGLTSGGGASWGAITGTLSAQTDLNTALNNRLEKANNLSDLASASTARTNLGLGTLATQNGTFSGTSSGTNTGDNATNTTSNSYADGKVENNLTSSTTVAPSKTAVNTALSSKTDYASVTCWHLANTFSDGTSYFFGIINQAATITSDARRRFFALLTGNIVTVHVITNATTPTSAQDVSLKINNLTAGTSVTVGAIRFDNVAFVFNFTGLTFAVTENDVLEFELVVPVLTTNGTACTTTCQVTFKKS